MSCKRKVSSGQCFFPTPFPVLCGKGSAGAEQSRAAVEGWEIPAPAQPGLTSPASGPALRTRKKDGWVRGREGGRGEEGEARQSGFKFRHKSKQTLSFPSAGLVRQQATSSASAPRKLGDAACAFPLLLHIFITLSLFPSHPSV